MRPKPFMRMASAIQSVLTPMNVPVSTTSSGLMVVTRVRRNSSTSTSAVMESYMLQRSGCGHSGVGAMILGHERPGTLLGLAHDAVFLLFFFPEEAFETQVGTFRTEMARTLLAFLFRRLVSKSEWRTAIRKMPVQYK